MKRVKSSSINYSVDRGRKLNVEKQEKLLRYSNHWQPRVYVTPSKIKM